MPKRQQFNQDFATIVLHEAKDLPPRVDLRPDMTPIEQQQKTNSCVANAFAGALEFFLHQRTRKVIDVSRLFVYYNARQKRSEKGKPVYDTGCQVADAIDALAEYGTCEEKLWPFDLAMKNSEPSPEAFENAKDHKIEAAFKIAQDLTQMKLCLANGFPFVFGLRTFKSFGDQEAKGWVLMPTDDEQQSNTIKRHAMLAVGYSDSNQRFIVRNSYGTEHGDRGYCYIPYEYITTEKMCRSLWAVRTSGDLEKSQEYWHEEDPVDVLQYPDNADYPKKFGARPGNDAEDNIDYFDEFGDDDETDEDGDGQDGSDDDDDGDHDDGNFDRHNEGNEYDESEGIGSNTQQEDGNQATDNTENEN